MSILSNLAKIYDVALIRFREEKAGKSFRPLLRFGESENLLALGDNLDLLRELTRSSKTGSIDFIYIDPPFFSGADYNARVSVAGQGIKNKAYGDRWSEGLEGFLSMLTVRLLYMKELLSDKGTIAVHMDRHAVHYAKILMDEIFGEEHFVNELIWAYKSGGASRRSFAHKHDTILVYSKTGKYTFNPRQEISYNRQGKPYKFKGVAEYQDDEGHWYTLVNHRDIINVDMVGRTSAERTGYATQKPEALLRLLVESFTDPGDLCADFFCGSGTLAAAASALGRRFICCDQGPQAVENSMKRLYRSGAAFTVELAENASFAKAKAEADITEDAVILTSYTRNISGLTLTDAQKEKLKKSKKRSRLAMLDFSVFVRTAEDGSCVHTAALPADAVLAFDAFGGMAYIDLKKE